MDDGGQHTTPAVHGPALTPKILDKGGNRPYAACDAWVGRKWDC